MRNWGYRWTYWPQLVAKAFSEALVFGFCFAGVFAPLLLGLFRDLPSRQGRY